MPTRPRPAARMPLRLARALTLVALGAGVLGNLACDNKRAIFGCSCSSDAECEGGTVCDDCACVAPCASHTDCRARAPNCNTSTGHCGEPCGADVPCEDPNQPNCGGDGLCVAPCVSHDDCTAAGLPNCQLDPSAPDAGYCLPACGSNSDCGSTLFPNCDSDAGTCYGPCQNNGDCAMSQPNCDSSTGLCYGPCNGASDCPLTALPVCDPAAGLCQGACPTVTCPQSLPRCQTSDGACLAPCTEHTDCATDPAGPNCNPGSGLCTPACTSGSGCPSTEFPNCDPSSGLCGGPCDDNTDCPDAALPNCDATSGVCFAPCDDDDDCPGPSICDVTAGLCGPAECAGDGECNPPNATCAVSRCICEVSRCEEGCSDHADCASDERCRLTGATPNRCEPRDCDDDTDCNPPLTVCDTDGGADPLAGGSCVTGCTSRADCPLSHSCDTASGACLPVDYGDVGVDCTSTGDCGNCASRFGIDDGSGTQVCTTFCCSTYDCPGGWACRVRSDGTSAGTHHVCAPLETGNGNRRPGEACGTNTDCRSNVCTSSTCRDSCCTDAGCPGTGTACLHQGGGILACGNGTATSDLGQLGWATRGCVCDTSPSCEASCACDDDCGACACDTGAGCQSGCGCDDDCGCGSTCDARVCYALWEQDTACTGVGGGAGTCANPNFDRACVDFAGTAGGANGVTDCVFDYCMSQCCTTDDCQGAVLDPSATGTFYCGATLFATNVQFESCTLDTNGAGATAVGGACTNGDDCRSNMCDLNGGGPPGVCRERCCTDAQCTPGQKCRARSLVGFADPLLVCVDP